MNGQQHKVNIILKQFLIIKITDKKFQISPQDNFDQRILKINKFNKLLLKKKSAKMDSKKE